MSPLSEEELDAMVDSERSRSLAPLNDWNTIAAKLREEGLIHDRMPPMVSRTGWWMRAAAVALIALGGAAVGRYTATRPAEEIAVATIGSKAIEALPEENPAPAAEVSEFKSADEAWAVLNRAGGEYQKASAYLAAKNTVRSTRPDSAPVYQSRLAALDQVMQATHSALDQAPNDPVINQYYLATMGAREATRQQLNATRMVGIKLKGF